MTLSRVSFALAALCLWAGAALAQPASQPAAGTAASAPASQPDDPTPLAKVGDQTITRGQVQKLLRATGSPAERWEDLQPQALTKLIYDALRTQFVKDSKVAMDDKAFEQAFQQILDNAKKQNIDLAAKLAERGVTMADLKNDEYQRFAFASALEPKLKEENVSRVAKLCTPYAGGEAVQVRHIQIAASPLDDARKLAEAKTHIEKIKADLAAKKITFEEAARMYSDDSGTAERGGQIGEYTFDQLAMSLLPLAQAAFAAKLGEVTGPVRTAFGYHLILVDNKTAPTTQPASQPALEALAKTIIRQNAEAEVLIETADKCPVQIEGYTPAPFTKRKLEGPATTQASQPGK